MRLHQGSPQEYKVKKGILSRTYPPVSGAYPGVSAAYSPILGVFRGKRGGVSAALELRLLFCKPKKTMEAGKLVKTGVSYVLPHYQSYFWPHCLGPPGPVHNFGFLGTGGEYAEGERLCSPHGVGAASF